MERLKTILAYILVPLLFVPCFAIFSEGDNIKVNLFGWAYTILLLLAVKYMPAIIKAFAAWRKSVHNLFPEINNL